MVVLETRERAGLAPDPLATRSTRCYRTGRARTPTQEGIQ